MNGLTFDRLATRVFPMRLVTLDGYRSMLENDVRTVRGGAECESLPSNKSVWEWVRLGASILWLDDNDLNEALLVSVLGRLSVPSTASIVHVHVCS
jgi:hypothetical protein